VGSAASSSAYLSIGLGATATTVLSAQQLKTKLKMDVPDMHTAVLQGPPSVCPNGGRELCLYVSGVISAKPAQDQGSTGLITATDLSNGSTYALPPAAAGVAEPVLAAPCPSGAPSCNGPWDSAYRGANLVFAAPGGGWAMIYHGQKRVGSKKSGFGFAQIGVARSAGGVTWTAASSPSVSGDDPPPVSGVPGALYGSPEPGAIVAGGDVYVFFPYIPTPSSPDAKNPPIIEAARASLSSFGPSGLGSWSKFDNGRFSSPAVGGAGTAVVPTTASNCSRPGQPWVGHSSAFNRYLMVFVCEQGWFSSTATSLDEEDWTPPVLFFAPSCPKSVQPCQEFTNGQPTDDNGILFTAGDVSPTIGSAGILLYAHVADWGTHYFGRALTERAFSLSLKVPSSTSTTLRPPPSPPTTLRPPPCQGSTPCRT
jgi:hypothetical protein